MIARLPIPAVLAALLLAGCSQPVAQNAAGAAPPAQATALNCPSGTGPAVRYELHLSGSVGAKEFGEFLDAEVTPRFQRGVTVVDSHMQSQESNGAISKEEGRLLIVVVPPSVTAAAYISALATAYDEKFDQDSALISLVNVCGGYIGMPQAD